MDDIIATTPLSQINGVEDYDVEELDFIEEQPEDIDVVCVMVNQQEELPNSLYPFITYLLKLSK